MQDSKLKVGRRELLERVGASLIGAALANPSALSAFAKENAKTRQAAEAAAKPDGSAKFWVISRLVTGRDRLEQDVAAGLYPYFRDEPWGQHNIHALHDKLGQGLGDPVLPGNVPELVGLGYFSDAELWFIRHVVTTWYLGIYYHERLTKRVLYRKALMWDVVSDMVEVSGFSNKDFGYWIEPPVIER